MQIADDVKPTSLLVKRPRDTNDEEVESPPASKKRKLETAPAVRHRSRVLVSHSLILPLACNRGANDGRFAGKECGNGS